MNYININKKKKDINGYIHITGSKSESNRFLILKALFPNLIFLKNISNSDDTLLLNNALFSNKKEININHSGTAMRFLTAFFSIKEKKEVLLTGSYRIQERPISILVETLKKLGANIVYEKEIGFPPLRIIGKKLLGGEIYMNANLSSQFISSIMLIASTFENGLKIFLSKKITSHSYIKMTFKILKKIGLNISWNNNIIYIKNIKFSKKKFKNKKKILIESDWSSASYYYSLVALSKKANLNLKFYKKKSLQGDKIITNIYKIFFNVKTIFKKKNINLKKNFLLKPKTININLNSTPDIAQTIAVTCTGLKKKCILKGLKTLKVKETDRLNALKNELFKLGVKIVLTKNSLKLLNFKKNKKNKYINTYDDHRMAMSFSTLGILYPISILHYNVINKSYPNFWLNLKNLYFIIKNKKI
ncbi:3-phosphoshikimate 1-carboxyvinyltransferase [Candidatus Karelsulcia muelleri CARI]|uniref:3-phosphoshikimate 1-carboxyvinyltransferase n=2 Tax=cellular organisms TaxID=131567 RepID=E0TJP2_KARMC|nr:3-phosphoshikimate 1-carboxyvinyltransferase [Candidatus Karelsulcia muelleri CARI]